jgi:hypothetical protein
MDRRRMSDEALAEWFSFDPVTLPVVPGTGEVEAVHQRAARYVPDVA